MRNFWGVGVFLVILGYAESFSQGLTLDSLVALGLRNNPDLLTTQVEGDVVASDTLATTVYRNPTLGFEAGYNWTDPAKPKAGVRLSKEFQPGLRGNQYQVSKANLAAKRQSQKSRELDIASDIRSVYYSWQILSRKKALQLEVEKRWETLSRIVSAKVKEGRLSQVDEAQAQLNRARARQKEMEIQTEMGAVENRLAYLTGKNMGPNSIAPYPIDTLPIVPSIEGLYKLAIEENLDLKTLDRELETQKRQLELEKILRNPSFTVSLGYDREAEGYHMLGGGIEFPLPIFNRNQIGLAKSRAEIRLAETRRAAAEARLKTEITEMHGRLESLVERYQSYQKEIQTLSRKQLDLSEKGFTQGLLGIFELSRVQEEFLSEEQDGLNILDAFYDQWNRLGKAVGGKTW